MTAVSEQVDVNEIADKPQFAEPTTLPELFERAAEEYSLSDALNYKADGEWRPISAQRDSRAC